jgi:hypothetical protein
MTSVRTKHTNTTLIVDRSLSEKETGTVKRKTMNYASFSVRDIKNENQKLSSKSFQKMPLMKCKCGFEILVIPDLKAMNLAITNHIASHKKKENKIGKSLSESSGLEEFLSGKLFEAVNQI